MKFDTVDDQLGSVGSYGAAESHVGLFFIVKLFALAKVGQRVNALVDDGERLDAFEWRERTAEYLHDVRPGVVILIA